jgi:SPP1 family predicted phage head-tail adaptor
MRIGAMDRRVTFQRKTVTTDSFGEEIETWANFVTVWAQVRAIRGMEYFTASQTVANVDTRFTIRHRNDVTPLERITYKEKVYDIKAVVPLGRNEALEIYATARAE